MSLKSVWHHLVKHYKPKRKRVPVGDIYASLNLVGVHSFRLGKPKDGREMLLKAVLNGEPGLFEELQAVLHETPHAPIEALYALYMIAPEVGDHFEDSPSKLRKWLKTRRGYLVVKRLEPHEWAHAGVHATELVLNLIKSAAVWIEAISKSE
jgi:hypothetical protein